MTVLLYQHLQEIGSLPTDLQVFDEKSAVFELFSSLSKVCIFSDCFQEYLCFQKFHSAGLDMYFLGFMLLVFAQFLGSVGSCLVQSLGSFRLSFP